MEEEMWSPRRRWRGPEASATEPASRAPRDDTSGGSKKRGRIQSPPIFCSRARRSGETPWRGGSSASPLDCAGAAAGPPQPAPDGPRHNLVRFRSSGSGRAAAEDVGADEGPAQRLAPHFTLIRCQGGAGDADRLPHGRQARRPHRLGRQRPQLSQLDGRFPLCVARFGIRGGPVFVAAAAGPSWAEPGRRRFADALSRRSQNPTPEKAAAAAGQRNGRGGGVSEPGAVVAETLGQEERRRHPRRLAPARSRSRCLPQKEVGRRKGVVVVVEERQVQVLGGGVGGR